MWTNADRAMNESSSYCDLNEFSSPSKRARSTLDSHSHRIIEKRRRDRMNSCLADLGRLVTDHWGQGQVVGQRSTKHVGQGRIKKTEIIEMAIRRIRQLQSQLIVSERKHDESLLNGFTQCRDVAMKFLIDQQNSSIVDHPPLYTKLLLHLQQHLQHFIVINGDNKCHVTDSAGNMHSGLTTSTMQCCTDVHIKPEVVTSADLLSTPEVADVGDDTKIARDLTSSAQTGCSENEDGKLTEIPNAVMTSLSVSSDCSNSKEGQAVATLFRRHQRSLTVSDDIYDVNDNRVYKYKDVIKRRFRSESETNISPDDVIMTVASNSGSSDAASCTNSVPDTPSPPSSNVNDVIDDSVKQLPGFVLHPTGRYYIPVMTSARSRDVRHHLYTAASSVNVVCHPVSIPVYMTDCSEFSSVSVDSVTSSFKRHDEG